MARNVEKTKPSLKRNTSKKFRWGEESLDPDEQHRLRRETIFRTAAQVFNETGFYTTTLDELAKRLNISKPTLYYYVKDKDDILFECQRVAFEFLKDALDEVRSGTEPGIEKLTRFLSRYTELMTNEFGACLIRTGLKPLKPESRIKLRSFARQLDEALEGVIAQGINDGSIRVCDAKLATFAVFGGFSGIARWFSADGPLAATDVANNFLDFFLRALVPDPPLRHEGSDSAKK